MLKFRETMVDYLANPADGSSTLRTALDSMADYLAKKAGYTTETAATILGTAIHTAILEPDEFDERYLCQEIDWGPKNVGLAAKNWKELKAAAAETGRLPLGYADYMLTMKAMVAASANPMLLAMQEDASFEVSAYAEIDGLALKARADMLFRENGLLYLGDLKTTCEAPTDENIFRIIFNNGYHFQAAHHTAVFNAALAEDQEKIHGYRWIFATTKTPQVHVRVVSAPSELLAWGNRDLKIAISRVLKAQAEDQYPGYPPVCDLQIPEWAYKIYEA